MKILVCFVISTLWLVGGFNLGRKFFVKNSRQLSRLDSHGGAVRDDPNSDRLMRTLRGEPTQGVPIWLMRQAGRYLPEFRQYSDKFSFRERSETPDIAIELSLQPWRRFGLDAVIMFSDILTPLPAMGIDFTMIPNKGPKILNPITGKADVAKLKPLDDPANQLPFVGQTLKALRQETDGKTTLVGFIGAPWTLAAYSVEGGQSKLCVKMKRLCNEDPLLAHQLLIKYTNSLCRYASYQIASGAQVIQIFESWAHHLTEDQFLQFAKPYVNQITRYLKEKHPDVPVIYFANGGSAFLHQQADMPVDALSIDWRVSMATARAQLGPSRVIQGNIDPMVLYGTEASIRHAVSECVRHAGSPAGKLILNLGHGVEKDTPVSAVEIMVDEARKCGVSGAV